MSTGQDIVDEVRSQLNDEDVTNLRWTDAEFLRYVNSGQRQVVIFVPEANIIEAQITIVADSGSRQTIPSDGVKFIKVSANFDTVDTVRGPAIRRVELNALDSAFSEWDYRTISATGEQPNVPNFESEFTDVYYEHYAHDSREPKVYYLYPRPRNLFAFDIMLVYSQLPADLTALSDPVVLTDEYQNAMVDYVIYRALSKDNRYGVDDEKRRALWNMFKLTLGMKVQQEVRVTAKANAPPEGP